MFLVKFNHGVEIGAELAYMAHYKATKDPYIRTIAFHEYQHRMELESILHANGHKPNPIIDGMFTAIGTAIGLACQVSPRWAMNWVARSMEVFAVFSYRKLAKKYPKYKTTFLMMAVVEDDHRRYFEGY